jgi:NAD dependent epimerase/dehydratase family.
MSIIALTSQADALSKKYEGNPRFHAFSLDERRHLDWESCDFLVNCAFPRDADGIEMAKGLAFIADVLKMAVEGKVGAVINISSQSVYSQTRAASATEKDLPDLESKYAVGKYASELLTNAICHDTPHTNVRMASLIGPGFDARLTNKMIDSALRDGRLTIKAGKQKFGFLDIEDAVSGLIQIINSPVEQWKNVYNLGGDGGYSLAQIAIVVAAVIKKELNREIGLEIVEDETQLNTTLECSLLRHDTGYRQQVALEASVLRILQEKQKC